MTREPVGVTQDPLAARELVTPLAHVAVVGVDPSLTHTGVCVLLDGNVTREYALETSPEDGPRPLRLALQRSRLSAILQSASEAARALVVAMEAEVWMASHTASEQAAIQAVYQVLIWETQWPITHHFLPVNVTHVKKFAGAAQKDQILLQVFKKWGREYADHNLADAFVIALIGHAYYCRDILTSEVTKPQREVLAKLSYPWEQPVPPPKASKEKGERSQR